MRVPHRLRRGQAFGIGPNQVQDEENDGHDNDERQHVDDDIATGSSHGQPPFVDIKVNSSADASRAPVPPPAAAASPPPRTASGALPSAAWPRLALCFFTDTAPT